MIKCISIDDEPIALSILREYCSRYGGIELECFSSPIAGMERIESVHPDVVFLDIEMNSHNGIEMAGKLPPGTCLIFTTAYANYALEGFNVDAVDFLHKPIFYPRFEKAMEKARRFLGSAVQKPYSPTITLKADYKNVVVNLQDILVIEAMDNYVKIHRKGKPMIVSQITMKEVETMLPEDSFLRIHRSFIIAVRHVEKYSNRTIYINGYPRPIPAGRKYLEAYNRLTSLVH